MRAVGRWVQPYGTDPVPHEAGVLPRRYVQTFVKPAGPKMFRTDHQWFLQPSRQRLARAFRDLETHQPLSLALDDRGALLDVAGGVDIGHLELHQVKTPQLAVDGEVE